MSGVKRLEQAKKANQGEKDYNLLSKEAKKDYDSLKENPNIKMKGVPWWVLNKDLRGGYKKGKKD